MQQRDMGVPLCANVDAETQGMIFRKTEVIRSSFIHEGEAAGRSPVPGIRRKHIQNGLQLCQESGLFFGLLAFINVDSHLPPAGFVHRPSGVAALWLTLSLWIHCVRRSYRRKLVRATVRVRAVHRMRHHPSAPALSFRLDSVARPYARTAAAVRPANLTA